MKRLTDQQIEDLVLKIQKTKGKEREFLFTDLYKSTLRIFHYLQFRNGKEQVSYRLDSADRNSVINDVLVEAVKKFDRKKGRFKTWLFELSIYRFTSAERKLAQYDRRHEPVSLSTYLNNEETIADTIEDGIAPDARLMAQDEFKIRWHELIRSCSKYQLEAIKEIFINGSTYAEAGKILGKTPKSIENAIQKVKQKVKKGLVAKKANN